MLVILPIIAILYGVLSPQLKNAFDSAGKTACGTNLKTLHNMMSIYASENNHLFPAASKWCDVLISKTDVNLQLFVCKVAPEKSRCNYAINKNIEKLGTNAPPDMVLIFETLPGWNEYGGPEKISLLNHKGQGSNILFVDGHVEFVATKDIPNLQWTSDQK